MKIKKIESIYISSMINFTKSGGIEYFFVVPLSDFPPLEHTTYNCPYEKQSVSRSINHTILKIVPVLC